MFLVKQHLQYISDLIIVLLYILFQAVYNNKKYKNVLKQNMICTMYKPREGYVVTGKALKTVKTKQGISIVLKVD